MLWAIDAGNTLVKFAAFVGETIIARASAPTIRLRATDDLGPLIEQLTRQTAGANPPDRIAVCCVVPRIAELIRTALPQLRCRAADGPCWIGAGLDLGIEVGVKEPDRLGADRIADAVGAVHFLGTPVIAVNCGTAITATVVDQSRKLLGGAIAPGPGTAAAALASFAAQLPAIEVGDVPADCAPLSLPRAIGRSTEEAIAAGVLHGAVGMVRQVIYAAAAELQSPLFKVLTGGYADLIASACPDCEVMPDLTFHGIRLIAERNA